MNLLSVSRLAVATSVLHSSHYLMYRVFCTASSTSMASSEGGLASGLWNNNRSQAMLALYHPFVVSLAAGVLNISSFRHYIAQDAFFLQAFAIAYGLARDNVDDDSSKLLINQLLQAVTDELKLHSSYAQAWGVDLSVDIKPDAATLKYTEFLLATAAGGVLKNCTFRTLLDRRKLAALTIGAMTPCMRLYAFLGQEIAGHNDKKFFNNPYHEWIDTYSSKAFQSSTLQIEQLLQNLGANLGEDDVLQLESLYSEALSLELDFFSGQPNCECALLPFIRWTDNSFDYCYLLMSDFDLTCSVTDSCSALANFSIQTASIKEKEHTFHISSSELKRKWEFLEKSYSEQYMRILTLPENVEDCHRSYDPEGLRSFLEQLSPFEVQSNSKIIEKNVFQGLDLDEVQRAGSQMDLQEGCSNFFQQISRCNNVNAHIVSVCWSKVFIEGALQKGGIHSVKVHSNELKETGSHTSGDLLRVIETPFDKEKVFEELLKHSKEALKPVSSIYIGDSVTDLVCLLKADLGIVVGSNSTLRRLTEAFGVSLVPLYKGVLGKVKLGGSQRWQRSEGVLYTVTSWHEIHAFMLGLPRS